MAKQLQTGLKAKHLSMMSIAGVIGAALFIGSGKTITLAGPAVILAYIGGGFLVVCVMQMLGEMAIANPDTGSFSAYADKAIGRWAGFTIGWLYWLFWSTLMGWESYVAGQILHNWFTFIPAWQYALFITVALIIINLLPVHNFGEFEFWFALIKVVAIVLFISIGSLAVLHLWPLGSISGISHLTADGGFMPNGPGPVVVALLGTMFAFLGAEIVTIAASESVNPQRSIIKATRSVVWRICLFYVGSIFIVVCLVPWNHPDLSSPTRGSYNVVMSLLGIPYTNVIVNFVVLLSVCSCFNSALYTASRMLYSLAKRGDAPKPLSRLLPSTGSPGIAVLASSVFGFIAIYLSATSQMDLYDIIMQITGCVALLVYLCIAFSQLKMRKKLDAQNVQLSFKMWLFPWLTYLVIIFIIVAIIVMVYEGTYFVEVVSTLSTAVVIIIIGAVMQKYNIGRKEENKS